MHLKLWMMQHETELVMIFFSAYNYDWHYCALLGFLLFFSLIILLLLLLNILRLRRRQLKPCWSKGSSSEVGGKNLLTMLMLMIMLMGKIITWWWCICFRVNIKYFKSMTMVTISFFYQTLFLSELLCQCSRQLWWGVIMLIICVMIPKIKKSLYIE